ncbi:hypothetical protein FACS1894160_2900 [Bacteroidia bacterium]|nr:hypothetical protein FACS1894160_2900 [Bacteroidia bacterium]
MENKLLTLIIPFLNEGEEVENTLISILSHSNGNVEIILINDASTDGFDYSLIAEKYGFVYVENEKRIGVAASRDLGVFLCQTPYFLLLDAHMRFYDNLWVDKIVSQLKKYSRILLCCQTKHLIHNEEGKVVEQKTNTPYGAYIDFDNSDNILNIEWTYTKIPHALDSDETRIACVLGAGYACSKMYWLYLKGLNGLIYYGSDEAYISMKVWLEGGKCLLLEDVVIGHIYRKWWPYSVEKQHTLYNSLLIAELLLPETLRKQLYTQAQSFLPEKYNESLSILKNNEKDISALKSYYKQIFKNDFQLFMEINTLAQGRKN